jgi:HlyD family secretion protein
MKFEPRITIHEYAMKWVKIGLMILVGLAIVAGIVYGFMPKPVPSEFANAGRGNLRVTIDEEGFTRVKDRFTISAPLMGEAARIDLKPGDSVNVGAVITTLAPTSPLLLDARSKAQAVANAEAAEASVKQAEAQLEAAQAQLDLAVKERGRLEKLKAPDQVSTDQVEAARLKEAAAQATVKSADFGVKVAGFQRDMAKAALIGGNGDAALDSIEIRSPVKGQVLRVYHESAGPVQAGTMLIEIGDPRSLEAVVDLLSSDAVRVKPGMKVSIERWGGAEPLEGKVRRIEPSGFTKVSSLGVEEQRVNVIIDFVGKPEVWSRLGDQFRVEARVITTERRDVIKVPAGALFNTPDGTALFVVVDGKAEQRVVELGERNGLEAEIRSNLNDGDTVIVHPSDDIEDGSAVEPR